jgi:ABC-type bacteriocin/lantibiotic exporter with double-glycine peptidase domain
MDLNGVLDGHHYITVPVMTISIVVILSGAVVFAVIIVHTTTNAKRQDQKIAHMAKEFSILMDAVRNREEVQEEEEPGYSLGASPSLIAGLQEHEASTAGHSLGMQVTGLQGEAAAMLGGFHMGRD